jgi:hypothetical protein
VVPAWAAGVQPQPIDIGNDPRLGANARAAVGELRPGETVVLDISYSGVQHPGGFARPGLDESPELLRTIRDELLARAEVNLESVVTDLSQIGVISVHMDEDRVRRLLEDRRVRTVGLLPPMQSFLAETWQQSNFGHVQAAGYDGSGVVVAVIDNGFSQGGANPHPNVPVVARQACYCQTDKGVACCANNTSQEVGPNAARYIGADTQLDPGELSQIHGTSVLSTLTQTVASESGLASSVTPVVINIGGTTSTGAGSSQGYTRSGLFSALGSMLAGGPNADVSVVNLSFGYAQGYPPATCVDANNVAASQLIQTLHGQGKTFTVAAGNSGTDYVYWPACLPQVISVAAAWNSLSTDICKSPPPQSGDITCYSNRNDYIDLAAAGSLLTLANSRYNSAVFNHNVVERNGTSFAAPVVAACAARLKQAQPGAGPEALRTALRTSSTTANLPGNAFNKPLLDCAQALSVSGAPLIPVANAGLSGAWFEPRTSGQGFYINVYPAIGQIWLGWFTYDTVDTSAQGRRWYTLQNATPFNGATTSLALTILQATGGQFNAPPSLGAPTPVGSATLSFTSCSAATLDYQFNDGRNGTIPLTRLDVPYCHLNPSGDVNFTGLWHNPATSGQGMVFRVMPDSQKLVGAWFTFDSNAVPGPAGQDWFTVDNGDPGFGQPPGSPYNTVTNNASFGILQNTGGIFNAPPTVPATLVGQGSVTFTSCTTATMSYSLSDGRNGTIPLERVGPAVGSCN